MARYRTTHSFLDNLAQNYHSYQKHSTKHSGGGLTVFVRKTLLHTCVLDADPDLDIILIHTNGATLVLVYIPPAAPPSRGGVQLPTLMDLWRTFQTVLGGIEGQRVVLGDLNAKISAGEASGDASSASFPARQIQGLQKTDTTGRQLLATCREMGMVILNGRLEAGAYTRPVSQAVLDYGIADAGLYSAIQHFSVKRARTYTDHNALFLQLPRTERRLAAPKQTRPKGPPRLWGKEVTKHYTTAIAASSLQLQAASTCADLTEGVRLLVTTVAAAGKLARTQDTAPNPFQTSHDLLLEWQRDPQRRALERECSLVQGRMRYASWDEHQLLRAELTCLRKTRNKLRDKMQTKVRSENAKLLAKQFRERPHEAWQVVKQAQTARDEIPIPFPDRVDYLELLADAPRHIVSVVPQDPTLVVPLLRIASLESSALLLLPVTVEEVGAALDRAANGRAADEDGIIMEQWKEGGAEVQGAVAGVLNRMLAGEKVADMGRVKMTLLHKKGPKDVVGNYRALSVGPMLEKLFSMVWGGRMTRWAEENKLLDPAQYGFRARRSTMDAVFVVDALMTLARERKESLILVFVDFTKAFDTIDRDMLWDKLARMGVPEEVLAMFRMAYGEVWGRIQDADGTKSAYVRFLTGVKQGDPLSTLFFILFINDVVAFLRANGALGVDVRGEEAGGEAAQVLNIVALLFADDTTLVAKTMADAHKQLMLLSAYASTNRLEVNVLKTEWMGLRIKTTAGGLTYRGKPLEKVDYFPLLGVLLESTGRSKQHLAGRQARMTAALGVWKRLVKLQPGMPIKLMLDTFYTLVASGGQYGNHLVRVGVSDEDVLGKEKRDEVVRMALRFVTGLPRSTPVAALFAITGRRSLASSDHKAALRYWTKLGEKDDLVKACAAALKRCKPGKNGWMDYIRNLLVYYGGADGESMWAEDKRTWSAGIISDIVDAKHDLLSAAALHSMPRLDFMEGSYDGRGYGESVALLVKVVEHRTDLLRLLCGGHKLATEAGRHANVPVAERRCWHDPEEIEDEGHFLFSCSGNTDLRSRLQLRLDQVQRTWCWDTWAWMLTASCGPEEGRRRRGLEAVATFVSKSFQRTRAGGQ